MNKGDETIVVIAGDTSLFSSINSLIMSRIKIKRFVIRKRFGFIKIFGTIKVYRKIKIYIYKRIEDPQEYEDPQEIIKNQKNFF